MVFIHDLNAFKMPGGLISLELIPHQIIINEAATREICTRLQCTLSTFPNPSKKKDDVKLFFENFKNPIPIGRTMKN